MTPEQARWQRLKLLYEQALAKSHTDQADFLRELAIRDPKIAAELADLLRAHDQPTSPLDEPLVRFSQPNHTRQFQDRQIVLDRFEIVRFLGAGGMGEVYEANDSQMGRVALKTVRRDILSNQQFFTRLRKEAQIARQIANPFVCRVYELFLLPRSADSPGGAFITMEFLEGSTLSHRIKEAGALSWKEAREFTLQICSGLNAIHNAGIVHRDIKTGNIMLAQRSGSIHAVLMDFGLARESLAASATATGGSSMTQSGVIVGTPDYMAPEQFQGSGVSPATDIYSLGIVLYEMATGKLPFSGSTPIGVAVGRAKPITRPSAIRHGLPTRWDRTIERCLRFNPEERFQNASDVAAELTGKRAHSPSLLFRSRITLAALLLLLLVALPVAWWRQRSSPTEPAAQAKRIAVLPFDDLSHDPKDQAFCDGLVEVFVSQLTELERFQGLLLVIPSSEIRHRHIATTQDAQKSFGVNLVITGSVQRVEHAVHLFISIIDAKEVKQIRSKEIVIPESDLVAIQSGIVSEIAGLLQVQLPPEARQSLNSALTTVPGAYDYYVQGYGYLRQIGGLPTINNAIDEFEHALAIDPSYALAHAGLGEAYWQKYHATQDRSFIEKAWTSTRHAVSLNNNMAAAHNTLGLLKSGTGDYQAAIAEYQRSLLIDPNNRDAFSGLARTFDKLGDLKQAEATFKRAIASRPDYWDGYMQLATFYKNHGRYQDAILPLLKVTELVPDNPLGHAGLGGVYEFLDRDQLAETEYEKSLAIHPSDSGYSNLGTFYFYRSRFAEAADLYEKAAAIKPTRYDYWGNLGDAYRLNGDAVKARGAYTKAIALCRQAISVNKADGTAMSSVASYLAKSGESREALRWTQRASAMAAGNSEVFYDLALTYELSAQRPKALQSLKSALALGYSRAIVSREPDLVLLRKDPAFTSLMITR